VDNRTLEEMLMDVIVTEFMDISFSSKGERPFFENIKNIDIKRISNNKIELSRMISDRLIGVLTKDSEYKLDEIKLEGLLYNLENIFYTNDKNSVIINNDFYRYNEQSSGVDMTTSRKLPTIYTSIYNNNMSDYGNCYIELFTMIINNIISGFINNDRINNHIKVKVISAIRIAIGSLDINYREIIQSSIDKLIEKDVKFASTYFIEKY